MQILEFFNFINVLQVILAVRILDDGPEKVLGYFSWRARDGFGQPGQKLLLPTAAGDLLLPPEKDPSQGPEASESAHRQERHHQGGRFRPGQSLRDSREGLHTRSGDLVVQGSRDPFGSQQVFVPCRHLVHRMHLCRNGQQKTLVSGTGGEYNLNRLYLR